MKAVIVFLLYLAKCSVAHYYWEDYNVDSIPSNAIAAGIDGNEYATYIGLVAAMDNTTIGTPDLVSATLYYNDTYGYAAYHSAVYKTDKGVKILCSGHQDKLQWEHDLKPECTLVRGSYTNPYTNYYIGRSTYLGQLVTGRFTINSVLLAPWKDQMLVFSEFEKLMDCP